MRLPSVGEDSFPEDKLRDYGQIRSITTIQISGRWQQFFFFDDCVSKRFTGQSSADIVRQYCDSREHQFSRGSKCEFNRNGRLDLVRNAKEQDAVNSKIFDWSSKHTCRFSVEKNCSNRQIFLYLEKLWGLHTIYRCASITNCQTARYNSLFHDPGTHGVDCLTQQDWNQHNNYVNPKFCIIHKV